MSRWGRGATWQWAKTRRAVLDRDGHQCQLRLAGCIDLATQAHHLVHTEARDGDPHLCVAVCVPCHTKVTEQAKLAAKKQSDEHRAARRRLPVAPHPGG